MPSTRGGEATLGADGHIYVAGGITLTGEDRAIARVEIYDPVSDTWTAGPSLNQPRMLFAMATADDRVWAIGGESDGGDDRTFYDTAEYLRP